MPVEQDQYLERVPLSDLTPFPNNPRRGDVESIKRSLVKRGQYKPLVVSEDNVILVGNHTAKAMAELGEVTALVVRAPVHSDSPEAAEIVLVDNRLPDLGTYDEADLAGLLSSLPDLDIAEVGYTADDLSELLASLPDVHDGYGYGDDGRDDDTDIEDASLPAPYDDEQIIELAYEYWRGESFPYPSLTRHEMRQQINKLARTATESLRNSVTAYGVPDTYHPHRFSTPIPGKFTPTDAFNRDDKLRHVMRLLVQDRVLITPNSVRSLLGYVRNSQCAANFRPGFALLLLRRYAPDGGVWLDTSSGFGGRIVAFAASTLSRYIGIDPSTLTHAGNTSMVADLDLGDRVSLIMKPAEDVDVDEVGGVNSCDFAFTSPPYFSKERYADESTQSWTRYTTGHQWRDGFLLPTLQLQFDALKPGCVSVVNIADVKIGNEEYPLVQWTIDCAEQVGFVHEHTDKFPLSRVPGQGDAAVGFEPVLIFRKPAV